MKRFMLVSSKGVVTGDEDCVERWHQDDSSWLWLDIEGEDALEEASLLSSVFGIEPFDIEEAQRTRHPPSIELRASYTYMLTKPLDSESYDLDFSTIQLALFVGDRFIVTRRSGHSNYIQRLWETSQTPTKIPDDPLRIFVAILKRITDRYATVLLNLESRLGEIEDILMESPSDSLMKELVGYNTALRKMRRIIAYHANIFDKLLRVANKGSLVTVRDEIDDICTLMERNRSLAELYQGMITDLIDGYISLNGHYLNQIMKVLTIVTVIFVPITFMAGIYGMNFEHIPELKAENGYYILLSVMLAIVAILLMVFRRARWL